MTRFSTVWLPAEPTVTAPDGSDVRVLASLPRGSMAHFELAPGLTSAAVAHRSVEELWYVVAGTAEMWRSQDGHEEVTTLTAGCSLSLPLGTRFQFRSLGPGPFRAVGVTLPPWPGHDEAFVVPGRWQACPSPKADAQGSNSQAPGRD